MRLTPLLLLLAAGCGRVAFDTTVDGPGRVCDAPTGHDEDGDGIDDACDGCPHLPDPTQPDEDGDGVDDACDPRPSTAGDTIVRFDPMLALDPTWTTTGSVTPTFTGDALHADLRGAGRALVLRRARPMSQTTYVVGGSFGTGDDGISRQILLAARAPGPAYYYCELQGIAPAAKVAATYTLDGASYTVLDRSDGPALENRDFLLAFTDAYPAIACDTTWPVPDPHVEGTVTDSIPAQDMSISAQHIDLTLQYFVEIRSN